ncbi:MAG: hypothetical protein GTO45_06675 [Candidatus Aminicenantes bacterium]|nr:hypothetical protein [Candidatus Aminicenantes bacterium]NIM78526.1 hypothetical protein [Candidatus Aminicenantes bacterium]NIN17771.1 hypothetical protein [Candidatus Aminicenantes bacterium]NIN41673.1 hypothetical protein [Candidatus Aminicenantes bacterium]NIN84422.1 hypothetical protein [Candidatus Aminicenantes bacterium]
MNTISKGKLLREIGMRLRQVRRRFNLRQADMALQSDCKRTTYVKNESGETFPGALAFRRWADGLNISLDWLICDRGSMVYKPKEQIKEDTREKKEKETPKALVVPKAVEEKEDITLSDDVRELLEHMEQVPLLYFEVLAFFHRFKLKYRELFEPTLRTTDEERE